MRKTFLFFLLLVPFISSSQQQMGPYMAYGPEAGYFAGLNFSVYQSHNGYLWIGTPNGVVRFDGKQYKNFFPDHSDSNSPSDNTIFDIAEDKNGELWFAGFMHGATRYNQRSGKFTKYSALSKDNYPQYTIYTITRDSDSDMWFATGGRGLAKYIYDSDSFQLYYPEPDKCMDGSVRGDNYVTDIIEDKSNRDILWCATFHGLFSFNKKTKQFEKYASGLQSGPLQDLLINTIELDNNGNIWAGSWGQGLHFFDSRLKVFDNSKTKSFPTVVYDLKRINDSVIYAACINDGLYHLNTSTGLFKNITPPRNLTDPDANKVNIQKISVTRDAGIFIGGNYYVYQQHPAYTRLKKNILYPGIKKEEAEVLLTGSVWDEKRQQYWITTEGGYGVYAISKDLQQVLPVSLINISTGKNYFHDLVLDALSRIWLIGNATGILRLNPETKVVEPVHEQLPVPDSLLQNVWCLAADKEDNLWMMSGEKFICWNVVNNHVEVIPMQWDKAYQGLHNLRTAKMEFDPDGNAWLVTQSGLFQCKLKEKKVIHHYKTGNRKKDLSSGSFLSGIFNKYKNFWITSGNGIQVYDWKNDTVQANHTLAGGLPSMYVTSLAADTSGKIWAGSVTGIMRFDPTKKIWQSFNRLDGMERDFLDGNIFVTSNNKLFIDQQNGLLVKDADEMGSGSAMPTLRITALFVNSVEYKDSLLPEYTDHIELPYDKNNIDIEFAAMDWLYPFKTKYRYRIEGEVYGIGFFPNTSKTGFVTPGLGFFPNTDGRLSLAGLQPGKYAIHLRAMSSNGLFSKDIVFKIVIRQPFWQTTWFMLLCIAALLFITWLLYRYRIAQLKKMYEIRSGIAKNLHDEIGSTLTSIKILSEVSQSNLSKDQGKASSLIQKITEQSAEMQQSMNDIVWAIQPDNDKLQNMVVRMREYLGHTLEPKNIHISFTAEKNVLSKSFGMKQRRDFFLIFKEAVNNVAKYSKCSRVDIGLKLHHNNILLTIEDDGIGFDTSKITSSNGLKNMKSRAVALHGSFAISSEPGKGTAIRVEVPAT